MMSRTRACALFSILIFGACQVDVGSSGGGTSGGGENGASGASGTDTGAQDGNDQGATEVNGPRLLGRVNPTSKQLTWAGTGIAFRFKGTTASVKFAGVTGNNSVDLFVDNGSAQTTATVAANVGISTGKLSSGEHNVVLIKRNEASFGTLTFDSVTTDGAVGTTSTSGRRIEFIGDSITVGYGAAGTSPCDNSPQLEDAAATYGALTAEALGADYSLVAWSGKGLTRNAASSTTDSSPVMPDIWTRYGALDASGSYTFPATMRPQAVVINLGTNDFSYNAFSASGTSTQVRDPLVSDTYQRALVAFIKQIQEKYPNAHIFLTTSPMLSNDYPTKTDAQHQTQFDALTAVVTTLSDPKIHVVDFATQVVESGKNGCDSHPSIAEHKTMAGVLTPVIKNALGW